MTDQVISSEAQGVVKELFSFKLGVLTDASKVKQGDCLIAVEDTAKGGGYVIHLRVLDESTYDLLKNPLDFYDIVGALEGRWNLTINDEIVAISYVRELRNGNLYPWCDGGFFTRPIKDKDKKIIGLEVVAQNNTDFVMVLSPEKGWEVTELNEKTPVAQLIPVNPRNPIIVGGNAFIIANPDQDEHFHYTLHSRKEMSLDLLSAIAGSILCSTFGTLEGHFVFHGKISVDELDNIGDDAVLKEAGVVRLKVDCPDEDTNYTVISKDCIQYRLQ